MSDNLSSFLGSAEGIPKRVMPIFFLIDTSGSMEGKKIGAVNAAIEELIPDLRHLSESQADSEIKLAVLQFATGCEWVTPSLMSLDSFDDWEPLEATGLTDLGAAFLELNDKLSKNGFMDRGAASSGFYAPVIILLSDGEPTDDYMSALKKLQLQLQSLERTDTICFPGEDANREVLKKAIRNVELLFSVNDIGSLRKVIRFIAVTSSQIASTSAAVSENSGSKPVDIKDVRPISAEQQMIEVKRTMEEENVISSNESSQSMENTPSTSSYKEDPSEYDMDDPLYP